MSEFVRKSVNSDDIENIIKRKMYGIDKPYGAFLKFKDLNLKALIKLNNYYNSIKGNEIDVITIYYVKIDKLYRGKGNFTEFINKIETIAKQMNKSIIIKEVINPNLENILIKKKYKELTKNTKYSDYIKTFPY